MKQLIFFLLLLCCAICSQAQSKRLVEISREYYTKDIPVRDGMVYKYTLPTDSARYYNPGPDKYEVTMTFKKVGGSIPIIQTVDANDFTGAWKKDPAGGFSYSNLTGQTLTYSFEGSGIKLIGQKLNSYGKVSVQIDNGTPVIIDMYSATLVKPFMFYETTFGQGQHTVVIKVTGQKNAASVNTYCVLDFVLISK